MTVQIHACRRTPSCMRPHALDSNTARASARCMQAIATSIFLMIFGARDAFAFIPEHHREYSTVSATIYLKYCAADSVRRSAVQELVKAVAQGAVAEDGLTVERATNWHFYNRDQKVMPSRWAQRNLDNIFKWRVAQLTEKAAKDKRIGVVYRAAGRVLHYVQDMSVPAHVVPIYHGPNLSDGFDSYTPADTSVLRNVQLELERELTVSCGRLRRFSNQDSFDKLLDTSARATLTAIGQSSNSNAASQQWLDFWRKDQAGAGGRLPGFAEYGPCKFTEKGARNCKIEPARLEDFFRTQYRQVLEDGIRILVMVESLNPIALRGDR